MSNGGGGGRNWRLVRADTDAVPPSVRRFMARARQRRLRAALPWAAALGVLVVLGGLAWVVYGTPLFGLRDVEVVGAREVDPEQVREAVAEPDDEPLARIDLDDVRSRVRKIPAVDRVVVRRSWPSSLVVEVIERSPVAVVPAGKKFTLLDRSGVAYRTVDTQPAGLPLMRLTEPAPGDLDTRSGLAVLGSLSNELRQQLVAVSVLAPAQIKLELSKDRVVVWGDDSQNATKSQVATALLKRADHQIDVSAPNVVTIR